MYFFVLFATSVVNKVEYNWIAWDSVFVICLE